jgi:uncharacterized protein (DUF486 family)
VPAVVCLAICGLLALTAMLLISPLGTPYADWISQYATVRRVAICTLLLNIGFVVYLFYFFSRLEEKNSIWLINIFIGWSIILAFGVSAALGVSVDLSIPSFGTSLKLIAAPEQKAFGLAIGMFFTVYSTNKYSPNRARLL